MKRVSAPVARPFRVFNTTVACVPVHSRRPRTFNDCLAQKNRAQAKELKDMSAAMSKAEKLLKALFVTMDKAAITN